MDIEKTDEKRLREAGITAGTRMIREDRKGTWRTQRRRGLLTESLYKKGGLWNEYSDLGDNRLNI